jgi:transposase-like protein
VPRYSPEQKEAILSKLLPPQSRSVREVALEDGVNYQTLYYWLKQLRKSSHALPEKQPPASTLSDAAKFAVVIETASLSEAELSQYCREKGLYPEQVHVWKSECMSGFQHSKALKKAEIKQAKLDKREIKQLKKELRRKEKALAETAALLVLRKKLNALWEEEDDEES